MAARVCAHAGRASCSGHSHPSLGMLFAVGRGERAFSTDNSYSGQQMRIERLWREFYLGSNHWRTKEGPDELLWIEDGGTHAIKKGHQYPLPGSQQLNGPPPGAQTGQRVLEGSGTFVQGDQSWGSGQKEEFW